MKFCLLGGGGGGLLMFEQGGGGGGGVMQKRESADFRFPEVGITEYEWCSDHM